MEPFQHGQCPMVWSCSSLPDVLLWSTSIRRAASALANGGIEILGPPPFECL